MNVGSNITIINRNLNEIDRGQTLHFNGHNYEYNAIRNLKFEIIEKIFSPHEINSHLYIIYNKELNLRLAASCYYFLEFWDILSRGIFIKNGTVYRSRNVVDIGSIILRTTAIGSLGVIEDSNDEIIELFERPVDTVIDIIVHIPDDEILAKSNLKTNNQTIYDYYGYHLYSNNKKLKNMVNIKIDTKYPLVKFRKYCKDFTIPTDEYGFLLNADTWNKSLLTKPIVYCKQEKGNKIIDDKLISNLTVINPDKILAKDLNVILNTYFKAKVKNADLSIRLFSNKRKKLNMLEESNNGKLFEITSFSSNYVCKNANNEIHDIVELKHGNISLKFAYSDIELHCINLNGINLPKNRNIEKDAECKIIRNKRLPIKLDTKVKVIRVNKSNRFVKNVIVKTEEGKEFVCHVKNLKRI